MSILDGTGLTPQPAGINADNPGRGAMTAQSFWQELRNNPRALLYAALMHLLLFLALILNLDWKTTTIDAGQSSVIKAQVVDSSKVQAEVNKLKQLQEQKLQQEQQRQNDLEKAAQQAEQRRVQEEQKLTEVKQKQVEEQQNLKNLEQQRVAHQKLEAERQSKLKIKQAEAEKQAQLKKEQDAKAAQQRAAAEQKKAAEQKQADAKQKAAADAKQKAAEEKKRQAAAAAKQQAEAERALQQSLAAEEGAMQNSARNQGVIDQYIAGIRSAVQNNWLQPPSARPGMQCTVRVNLIPGGDVAGVRIVVSSGDAAFDRSVENAVRKAAPLPLPPDPSLFNNFRELTFVFKPEN